MSEKDGGPAFPILWPIELADRNRMTPGMSLRDYFAGQAMQAALGNQSMLDRMRAGVGGDLTNAHEWLAEGSYLVADSMLKERAKV